VSGKFIECLEILVVRIKKEVGMGFITIKDFNLGMLANQGWHIIHNEESLLGSCLKRRYFSRTGFLNEHLGYNQSFIWRSILQTRLEVIDHVCL